MARMLVTVSLTIQAGWPFHSETEMDACLSKAGFHVYQPIRPLLGSM